MERLTRGNVHIYLIKVLHNTRISLRKWKPKEEIKLHICILGLWQWESRGEMGKGARREELGVFSKLRET